MVLDTDDKYWKKYLTEAEIREVKQFPTKNLPNLPSTMKDFVDSLSTTNDIISLNNCLLERSSCPASEWLRETIVNCFKLFEFGHVPVKVLLEADMLRRICVFLDNLFDKSKINCRGYVYYVF